MGSALLHAHVPYEDPQRLRTESKNRKLVLDGVPDDEQLRLFRVASFLCYNYRGRLFDGQEAVAKYELTTIETEFDVRRN